MILFILTVFLSVQRTCGRWEILTTEMVAQCIDNYIALQPRGKAADFDSVIPMVRIHPGQPNIAECQQWQLGGLISRRLRVRLPPPQPMVKTCQRANLQVTFLTPQRNTGMQFSWLERSADNRKISGSNPLIPTRKYFSIISFGPNL